MLKYWSAAVQTQGYQSTTLVHSVLPINDRGDFDRLIGEFRPRPGPSNGRSRLVGQ